MKKIILEDAKKKNIKNFERSMRETESTMVAVQDQTLCTTEMRNLVYGERFQFIYRVCGAVMKQLHILCHCVRMLKTSTKGVQASEALQYCQNDTLEVMSKIKIQ